MERNGFNFLDAYKQFMALWYEYHYIIRALKIAPPIQVVSSKSEVRPSSIILKGVDMTLGKEDKLRFYSQLADSNELSTSYFLLFYVKAEAILGDIEPCEDVWGRNMDFVAPEYFFSQPSFDDYKKVNREAINQISAVRHIWIHNSGKIDAKYLTDRNRFFPTLSESLNCLPKDLFFIEPVRKRLKLSLGEIFPIDICYLLFSQIFLLDRIFLKSSAYHSFFKKDGSDVHCNYNFDFVPAFCSEEAKVKYQKE